VVLPLGFGVVVLGLQGGTELDAGLEAAALADRLEGAVELGRSGAVAVSEQAVMLAAQPGHLGADRVAGQRPALFVEGVDLVGDGEVLIGDGAVGDLGVMSMLRCPSIAAMASSDMPRLIA